MPSSSSLPPATSFPPVSARLAPSVAWRVAAACLGAAVVLATASWAWGWVLVQASPAARAGLSAAFAAGVPWLPLLACLGAGALVAGMVRQAWRRPPVRLRWDGWQWRLQRQCDAAGDEVVVDLEVMADLQQWMLLRWRVQTAATAVANAAWFGRRGDDDRSGWIALEPASLDLPWHAWRCAVHGARPARTETLA